MSVSNAENSDVSNYNHKEKANLCFDRENGKHLSSSKVIGLKLKRENLN